MRQIWKAKMVIGKVEVLLPKEDFDKDDKNFIIHMCVNPQDILEFPAYNQASAMRIAEFIAKEMHENYEYPTIVLENLISYEDIKDSSDFFYYNMEAVQLDAEKT